MSESSAPEPATAESSSSGSLFSGRTVWHNRTALRDFLSTETGSASVLAGATVAALVWANVSVSSYDRVWATRLAVSVGSSGIAMELHEFVNSGLMALFFLVVGLEARREWDVGELRIRSRLALPVLVGLAGMIVPIGIYLIANAGRASAHAWGVSMATDTAFALGALALVGRRLPDRVRTYLLTFSVVDDLAGIAIIAIVYSGRIQVAAAADRDRVPGRRGGDQGPGRAVRAGVPADRDRGLGGVLQVGRGSGRGGPGHGPAVVRLPGAPGRAGAGLRGVPEFPRAAHGRTGPVGARRGTRRDLAERPAGAAVPPVVELRHRAAVRAGQRRDRAQRGFLARAYTSPVTLGILLGYLVGKPVGTAGCAWLVTTAQPRAAAAAGGVGRGRGGRARWPGSGSPSRC